MKPLDPETEKRRWRLALSLPAVVVEVVPVVVFSLGVCGWGRYWCFVVAEYANLASILVLLLQGALIASCTVHKRMAAAALVLAGVGIFFQFTLYSKGFAGHRAQNSPKHSRQQSLRDSFCESLVS